MSVSDRTTARSQEPLRIAHLIKGLGRGGAETLLRECIRVDEPGRSQYAVGYFLPQKDALVEDLRALGVEVRCFPSRHEAEMLLSTGRVARWLDDGEFDIVHCHLPLAGIVGRIAGKASGLPIVYTEHNVHERYHRVTYWANRVTWWQQDFVVAVSEEVARSIRAHAGERVPVRVVSNGVDVERFSPRRDLGTAVRRDYGIESGSPVVGTVAVFREQKRLDDWLRAARLLVDDMPETRFLLVGDGPRRSELDGLAATLGMKQHVRFAGLQEDVRPYLAAMDVYMMSSDFEGLPIALLEAMAMGVPPVCTRVGGIPEAVVDGVSGLLVGRGRPEALASAAGRLLADREARRGMGSAARRQVVQEYSMERMMERLHDVYALVCDRDASGARGVSEPGCDPSTPRGESRPQGTRGHVGRTVGSPRERAAS